MEAVKLEHVTKTFRLLSDAPSSLKSALLFFRRSKPRTFTALSDINLTVQKGEAVAVIGGNGSGKSTTLGLIGKIYLPTSGTVTTDGRICTMLDLGAGFHPELTGRENIYFNGSIMGLTRSEIEERIGDIIDFSELGEFIDSPIKTYSAGMKMRLGFSVATRSEPDILLIDEVLAVGDAAFQRKCFDLITDFKNRGRTIIFVTHDLEAALRVADRTVRIGGGKILADGDSKEIIKEYLNENHAD